MIDSKLRKYIQPGFDCVGKAFVKVGATPNQLTAAAFALGILAAVLVALKLNIWGLAALLLSGFIDIMDGTVARIKNIQSKKGAFLDIIFDKLVETLFILGLAIAYPGHYISYLVFLVLVIFNFSTFLIAGSLMKNTGEKSMHYDPGIAERTETFICFGFILIFPDYLFYILNAFNLLILITGIIRLKNILKLL
jgi:archaetidylinositol phosphate synthase